MFVAWRDLRFAKGRFALMGAVVVLMTTLVVLVSGLTAGLARDSTSAIADLPADHIAFGGPASFTESTVDARQVAEWARVLGVRGARPLGITTTKARLGARAATVSAFGVGPLAAGDTSGDVGTPAGGADDPSARQADVLAIAGPGAAVLSAGAAEDLSAQPGDVLAVAGVTLRVSAIEGDASYSHTPVIWTSLADWQRMVPDTHATVILLHTDGADVPAGGADFAAADARLGTTTVPRADALSAIGSFSAENGSLLLMRGFLFAISALVIGAFFTVWTIQRSGDIAVLKALGATTGYLLRDALGQAVLVLVAGTAVGAGIAVALGAAVAGTVPFVLGVDTAVLPPLVMTALGLLGAALSIRRITAVDPLVALSR